MKIFHTIAYQVIYRHIFEIILYTTLVQKTRFSLCRSLHGKVLKNQSSLGTLVKGYAVRQNVAGTLSIPNMVLNRADSFLSLIKLYYSLSIEDHAGAPGPISSLDFEKKMLKMTSFLHDFL